MIEHIDIIEKNIQEHERKLADLYRMHKEWRFSHYIEDKFKSLIARPTVSDIQKLDLLELEKLNFMLKQLFKREKKEGIPDKHAFLRGFVRDCLKDRRPIEFDLSLLFDCPGSGSTILPEEETNGV